ncbi:MAG: 50S ribosomal protein L11 methyltransferase [Acidobacteriota bacterium]
MTPPTYSRLVIFRKANDEIVVGHLSRFGPLGFVEEGMDLVACFRRAEDARAAAASLKERGIRWDLAADVAEGDPLQAFRAASRPFPVGARLWLDPGDPSDSAPPSGRVALRIPASRAFGTGGHESTRLALVALEEELTGGESVLDVGTGSGVLALAAAALGASEAFGYDTDFDAVLVARENVRRHSFGKLVRLAAAEASAVGGRFGIVVANLLPEEFFGIRAEVLPRVAAGGKLILSGIPLDREAEVVASVRSRKFTLAGRRIENDWTSVCLRRAS